MVSSETVEHSVHLFTRSANQGGKVALGKAKWNHLTTFRALTTALTILLREKE